MSTQKIRFVQTYLFDPPVLPLCTACNGVGGFDHYLGDDMEEETCNCCQGTGFYQMPVSNLDLWPDLVGV